jgi:hypothetical protein
MHRFAEIDAIRDRIMKEIDAVEIELGLVFL